MPTLRQAKGTFFDKLKEQTKANNTLNIYILTNCMEEDIYF